MQRLLLAAFLSLCYCSFSSAQQATTSGQTGDIIVLGNGWTGTVSQCTQNVDCWAGSSDNGDIHQALNTNNGVTYYWSGTQQTLSNTIAISQALQAAGIQVDGFDYEWVFKNGNANWFSGQPGGGGVDPFEIVVNIYKADGTLYKSYKYDYGNQFYGWTTKTGTETFGDIGLAPNWFGNVVVEVTGQDIAQQAGYWGPEFRAEQSYLYVNYSADLCYNNQLYDPACPGYATALYNQQCTANPLYDPGCPGYAAAFLTQQCAANPLYDPSCPGYATAYYNQQCTNDPTSDPGCPDYYVAMCEEDPLFDPGCAGYDVAYFDQQCSLDPQYDTTCPGYVDLSGNDGEFTVLSPLIDDVVNADPVQTEIYEAPVESFVQEELVFEQAEVEASSGFQTVDDDIDEELGELEMLDDIDAELAKLENESGGESDSSETGVGNTTQEDDIEAELAELEKAKPLEEQPIPGKAKPIDPEDSKRDKMRLLIAMKAVEAVKELEAATTLEQQMEVQRRLLALISFVPDFNSYAEKEQINQVNFYPPKPTVDHAYARWFLNDPNFGAMEDLQYQ